MRRTPVLVTTLGAALWALGATTPGAQQGRAAHAPPSSTAPGGPLVDTSRVCVACHGNLVTPGGEDVSFGPHWRGTMMANSARDPYWQAAVRRETLDHPRASAAIEDECSACHMPMTRFEARAGGHEGRVFAHLPAGTLTDPASLLAADGVSCTVCHQIGQEGLGTRASFTAGFHVDTTRRSGDRAMFGPYQVDKGRTRIMRSSSGFVPLQGTHVQSSEMCATCHTLITQAFGPDGEVVGELPEQVPYLEWQHSAYRESRSCQSCHMPEVDAPMAISSVWGQPRPGVSRHTFEGGNFFMLRVLDRYRSELGVDAEPRELAAAAARAVNHLQHAATLAIEHAAATAGRLGAEIVVTNLAGHKLPTAYPSRRAWLHLTVRDRRDAVVFESGAPGRDGRIAGNDNDTDASRFEPHHAEIGSAGDVQIYEAVMTDRAGAVTTGLLSAVRYAKDNRLLPRGFDKATAGPDVAVHGHASGDADFAAGGDRVRLAIDVAGSEGPYRLDAELLYQPTGYRWAQNLGVHDTFESKRFLRYFDAMAEASAVVLARATVTAP